MVGKSVSRSIHNKRINKFQVFLEKRFKWLMMIPVLIVIAGVALFPFFYSLYLSFTNASTVNFLHPNFVLPFHNYWLLLKSYIFWKTLFLTLSYVALTLTLEIIIGLFLAILCDRIIKGQRIIVSLLFTPMLISTVFAGIIFRLLMNPSFGVIEYITQKLGFTGFLLDVNNAFFTTVLIDVWQWTSFIFLIAFAGLRALPSEPFEAGKVFGATAFQTFRMITLPLLKPVLLIAIIFRMMDSFKAFDHIYALTSGGPGTVTTTLTVLVYKYAYQIDSFGMAAALGVLMLVIVIFATKGLLRFMPFYKEIGN